MRSVKNVMGWTALVVATMLLAPRVDLQASERSLTRSMYIPVHFDVCEHLENATLFIGETRVAQLPSERIFQFTYYPALDRLAPEATSLRVEGVRAESREPFVGRLAITPKAIYTARERIELGFEEATKQLAYRRDAKYEQVRLRIRCETSCPKSKRLASSSIVDENSKAPSATTQNP